ncbi:histidinol-phosphatase [Agrobacterium sp. ES01]|uniref:histidinol-phosphatase n=1 Tax=Agrobacterium sp. ES01 TaxID=3420714 RepID=UPI003D0EEAC4
MLPDRDFFNRLAEAAKAETLPRFRSRLDVVNKEQGGFDPVTEGDRAAEAAIRAIIEKDFPEHGILGEEFGNVGIDREHVWVIDPIDGTRAFISGVPVWGTLIGFQSAGRSVMGLMDQPFTGERYFADGERSWYSGPGGDHQLQVRDCGSLENATLFTTSPHLFAGDALTRYRTIESRSQLFRYGIDCYAYALLASGHIDLVIESGLKPYDVGALIPIIEQAGGIVTTWDGGRPEEAGTIIAAGSAKVHAEALAIMSGR